MPPPPISNAEFLASQVRWAMGRGLPAQVAEDVVFEAWERAAATFDPSKGSFEAYMQVAVRNACAYWWRGQARRPRVPEPDALDPEDAERRERAAQAQAQLLDALSEEERRVFAAWALQRHLGKGRVSAEDVGRSIGLDARAFENAKRRIKERLVRLLEGFGWSPAALLEGEDDVEADG